MEPSELLTPSPSILTDVLIGYARLSTGGQKLDRQVDALTAAGCRRNFADEKSSKNNLRAELMACHAFLTPGDTLVVPPRPLRPVTPGPRQHGRRTPPARHRLPVPA
ncbi:recombinase family protein [Streptomyces sp. NPDC005531]